MKPATDNKNINGWTVISKWLITNKKRQTDIAILLNITPSAVSQIKNGNILLNANQINLILDFLKIHSQDMCLLYTLIFNARLNNSFPDNKMSKQNFIVNIADSSNKKTSNVNYQNPFCNVPLITLKQAMTYEPALESIKSFASSCSQKAVMFPNAQAGSFALLLNQIDTVSEFKHSAILLASGEEYPIHGDMVVAKLRSGEIVNKYYFRDNNIVYLKSKKTDGDNFVWRCHEDPAYVQWMYPVIEAYMQMRA